MTTSDAERLAAQAFSDTVTVDVLLGNASYYPHILQYLYTGEQPHYVALLTINSNLSVGVGSQYKSVKSDQIALVATDQFVRLAGDESNIVLPYELLSAISVSGQPPSRGVELHVGEQGQSWYHEEAKTADEWIFDDTVEFIDEMIQRHEPIGKQGMSSLEELKRQHERGEISDAQYLAEKLERRDA